LINFNNGLPGEEEQEEVERDLKNKFANPEGDRVVIDNNPEIIENWRVDQVLTSVFEMPSARPAKIEPLLQRRKELLTKPKLTPSDRAELKELEAQIGTLPTAETSEDIKAMDIIRRAAKLLETQQKSDSHS
jgi:hypothetical protein